MEMKTPDKAEMEKLAKEIYDRIGDDIKKYMVQPDEGTANSYHVRISGESIEDMSVSLVQNGNYGGDEKYELEIPCVPLGDYVDFSVPDSQEGYFASAYEGLDLRDDIIESLTEQLSEYKGYIQMDKKIVQWIKENNNISYHDEEIAQLSFENKDGWLWEDWDFLYGNNPDNFPDDEKLPVDDEDFGNARYWAIKKYVNLVMYEYFEVE